MTGGRQHPAFKDLCLRLRCAAAVGGTGNIELDALLALRVFPEIADSFGTLPAGLYGLGGHSLVFEALHDALRYPVWKDFTLTILQRQLSRFNNLTLIDQAMDLDALHVLNSYEWLHKHPEHLRSESGKHPRLNESAAASLCRRRFGGIGLNQVAACSGPQVLAPSIMEAPQAKTG